MNIKMTYVKCEKYGKYRELKKGESADTESCECGGNYVYIQRLDQHIFDEIDPLIGTYICPKCETPHQESAETCSKCGYKLKPE